MLVLMLMPSAPPLLRLSHHGKYVCMKHEMDWYLLEGYLAKAQWELLLAI
jgi:hypothetical protein